MRIAFAKARRVTVALYNHFTTGIQGVARAFGQQPRVYTPEQGVANMRGFLEGLEHGWAPANSDRARTIRQCIMTRMKFLNEGRRINARIEEALQCIRHDLPTQEEVANGTRLDLRAAIQTEDLMSAIIDHFGPYDAGRLLRTCRWGDDIKASLKLRFPHLHIYRIPDFFPHVVDAGGAGYMHHQTTFKVALGLVYSKRRDVGADGKVEQDPGDENRPGVQCFEAINTVVGAKNCESWTAYAQPWTAEQKRSTIHPSAFFRAPPDVSIWLVDAKFNTPVVALDDKNLHGGLVPDKSMARCEVDGKHGRLMWTNKDKNPDSKPFQGEEFATMFYFKGNSSLLSSRWGCKFKLKATVTGISRATGKKLVMSTESDPFTIVSTLRNAKAATKLSAAQKRKRN